MKNWTLIGKIATFSAVASAVITITLAIITYFVLALSYSSAPIEYVAFVTLSTIIPYLLVTVIFLIIAVMSKGAETPDDSLEENQPTPEEEALPPAQPTETNA